MLLYQLQHGMLYIHGLYQHFALFSLPAGPSAHLLHQLEGPLIHPEIGKAQQPIRIQHTYQAYIIKIKSLHHHLGAYKHIDAMLLKLVNKIIMRRLPSYAVHIHPGYLLLREIFIQVLLNFFGTEIFLQPGLRAAGRAVHQHRISAAAIMAVQLVAVFVQRKRYVAVPALRDIAAGTADDIRIVPTPVLEKDHLLDSTIIFFYADHGEGMPRAKTNGIDLGYRVPFVIWFPEMYKHLSPWKTGGVVTDDLINFADLAPTLLGLAGAAVPDYMHGRKLFGNGATQTPKEMFLTSDGAEGVTELTRTVTDGRYSYSRIFLPFMPELFYKKYFDYGEIMQVMRADLKDGLLNNTQKKLFETRQTEYLFDFDKDPWQLNNLALDPTFQPVLKKMRASMEAAIVKNRDAMFMPEYELGQISKTGTPYEFRQNNAEYPIDEIYKAASLSGLNTSDALKSQVGLLKHVNRFVRYWAAMGLKSQGAAVKKYTSEIKAALKENYAPCRIILASVLYDQTNDSEAEAILKETIESGTPLLARLAIQMVQYQQHRDAFVPAVQGLLDAIAQKKRPADGKEPAEMFMYSVKQVPLHYETFW